jgi:hypothetical protein
MEDLLERFLQHGFSIAVASYLLIRMDRRMEELTEAVVRLIGVMENGREARNGQGGARGN